MFNIAGITSWSFRKLRPSITIFSARRSWQVTVANARRVKLVVSLCGVGWWARPAMFTRPRIPFHIASPHTSTSLSSPSSINIWSAVKINCWCLERKYKLSLFGGWLSLYSVLLKTTLNNAKMQWDWLHRFRSLNCWGWIKGRSLSLCLQPWSYLSTFLDSPLSKEICYNLNSELEWQ